jgi:hypothetical protein
MPGLFDFPAAQAQPAPSYSNSPFTPTWLSQGAQAAPVGPSGAPLPPSIPQENFNAATNDLALNPQERDLYQRHLSNLYGSGGVDNPDGSRSTLYQLSTNIGGRVYNLPTVYDGQIVPPDQAIQRAITSGLDKFPSYGSEEEAEARYQKMHDYMEKDTQRFLDMRKPRK